MRYGVGSGSSQNSSKLFAKLNLAANLTIFSVPKNTQTSYARSVCFAIRHVS